MSPAAWKPPKQATPSSEQAEDLLIFDVDFLAIWNEITLFLS